MKLVVGQTWFSPIDTVSVIVVKAPAGDVLIAAGGTEMVLDKPTTEAASDALAGVEWAGSLIGKRYVDEELGLELLCTKAGRASLAADGRLLQIKQAQPLPASD